MGVGKERKGSSRKKGRSKTEEWYGEERPRMSLELNEQIRGWKC